MTFQNVLNNVVRAEKDVHTRDIVLALVASKTIVLPSVTIEGNAISEEALRTVKNNVDIVRKLLANCD